ncbi:hypothetical protein AB0G06_43595 [Nonomuraea dietziae]|uniref:hypothetical protein n=1 Tax=Nonomuraea dietziae TaxID=65515 RepID=UPI0033F6160F
MKISRFELYEALYGAGLDEDALKEDIPYHGDITRTAVRIHNDNDAFRFFLALAEILYHEDNEADFFGRARDFANAATIEGLGKDLYLYLPGIEITE